MIYDSSKSALQMGSDPRGWVILSDQAFIPRSDDFDRNHWIKLRADHYVSSPMLLSFQQNPVLQYLIGQVLADRLITNDPLDNHRHQFRWIWNISDQTKHWLNRSKDRINKNNDSVFTIKVKIVRSKIKISGHCHKHSIFLLGSGYVHINITSVRSPKNRTIPETGGSVLSDRSYIFFRFLYLILMMQGSISCD